MKTSDLKIRKINLTISIFAEVSDWSVVFYECVLPLVRELRLMRRLSQYYLIFNFDEGSNLRLTFEVKHYTRKSTSAYIDAAINKYFNGQRFQHKTLNIRAHIFMPIAVNSVQYGLFVAEPIIHNDLQMDAQRSCLSYINQEIVCEDDFGMDSIFITGFCLIWLTICHFSLVNNTDFKSLVTLLKSPVLIEDVSFDKEKDLFIGMYQSNRAVFSQLTQGIANSSIYKELRWLSYWKEILENSKTNDPSYKDMIYRIHTDRIFHYLGLTNSRRRILIGLIEQVIEID